MAASAASGFQGGPSWLPRSELVAPADQDFLEFCVRQCGSREGDRWANVWSEAQRGGVDPSIAPGYLSDAVEGWHELTDHYHVAGVTVGISRLVMHEKHGQDPWLSECSTLGFQGTKLVRSEWFSADIRSYFKRTDQGPSQTKPTEPPGCLHFHGTTLKAAVSMLQLGGFIPGKNGHGKRGKYLQGLFCADSLGEAFMRADPGRALDSR